MKPSRFLVGGEWRTSAVTRQVCNPFDRRVVGEVYQAGQEDIREAIGAAAAGFDETRVLGSYRRATILSSIARDLEKQKEPIARLITAETGKPIAFSRAEVERSAFTFQYAAEEAGRLGGTLLPLDLAAHSAGRFGIVRRFPLGVIGAITPFNFPVNLVAHKIAPAIAAGNSFVLKPSSNAPQTALLLGEIILNSGYPPSAVNVLPCSGNESSQLILDKRVKLLSFTGSPAVGWSLKTQAGEKRVVLELGGNAGVIIDRSAVNLGSVARRIAMGAHGNAGQSCIAVQRVFAHREIYESFLEEFVRASSSLKVGDPEDESTVVGPMIDEAAAVKVEQWVSEAIAAGARLLCGGRRERAVIEPTVLAGVRPDLKVSCQEVFAPVATIDVFDTFEQALAMVNDSAYGLQAGVFTNDFGHVLSAFNTLEVGGVIVNDYPTYRIDHMPYGGVKASGSGREGVAYAIEEMTEQKLLVINPQALP